MPLVEGVPEKRLPHTHNTVKNAKNKKWYRYLCLWVWENIFERFWESFIRNILLSSLDNFLYFTFQKLFFKIVFGPQIFWIKLFSSPKHFRTQIFLVPKNFWAKDFWTQHFWTKDCFVTKISLSMILVFTWGSPIRWKIQKYKKLFGQLFEDGI